MQYNDPSHVSKQHEDLDETMENTNSFSSANQIVGKPDRQDSTCILSGNSVPVVSDGNPMALIVVIDHLSFLVSTMYARGVLQKV